MVKDGPRWSLMIKQWRSVDSISTCPSQASGNWSSLELPRDFYGGSDFLDDSPQGGCERHQFCSSQVHTCPYSILYSWYLTSSATTQWFQPLPQPLIIVIPRIRPTSTRPAAVTMHVTSAGIKYLGSMLLPSRLLWWCTNLCFSGYMALGQY